MHCPGCGHPASMDQRFCRSCGMDLQEVSEIVKARASSDDTTLSLSEHERKAMACMTKGMGRGGVVLFIGLAMIVVGKKYFHNELFTVIATLVTLLGVFIMAYALYSAMMSEAKAPGGSRRPKVNTRPDLASARGAAAEPLAFESSPSSP